MSEVTSSIEERLMRYRQSMSTLPHRMLKLTILVGMIALAAAGEGIVNEFNGTASELPVELTTTVAPPLREAVTDLFTAPIAAFKVQVPLSPQLAEGEEGELAGLPLGKAENNTDPTPSPPFSNLWFNAGQSLGSAANSLTGWLNSRLIPQTTSTTTRPPEVIVRLQSNQAKRKPLISIADNRKTQANRLRPVIDDNADEDGEDDDEDPDDDEEYDDGEEEQVDEEDSNPNRYSSNDDEDDEYSNDEEETEDDEEEEKPIKKRKNSKQKQKRPANNRRGYDYEEEENEDYDDDDEDYDYDPPKKHSGRQQQQDSFLNRFRQLAQLPYSSTNKQQNSLNQGNNPGYRPVRIVQNGQVLQLIQDRPSQQNQQQVKRQKRPSNNQNTFQLIPIRNQQVSNAGQKQKRRKVNKPDPANQIVIPIPQSVQNGQQRPSQYITIPWSQLGLSNPQQDYSQSGQQAAPIIVNIPQHALQQNSNRRRRPVQNSSQVVSTPQRKRLRRPLKTYPQNSQIVSLLTDQSIRDILRVPEIPPSRTPQEDKRKRPVKTNETDNITTISPNGNSEPEPEMEEDDEESEDAPYIVVGDDDTADAPMARQVLPQRRYLHIGGMKPYVDVLNKGRIYLKAGRQLRMDSEERPESKITSISSERTLAATKGVQDITTESSLESKANAPPTILLLGSEDSSTTGNPLPP